MPPKDHQAGGVAHERWQHAQEHEVAFTACSDPRAALPLLMRWHEPAVRRVEASLPEEPRIIEIGAGPICLAHIFSQGTALYTDPLMHQYHSDHADILPSAGVVAAMGEVLPCPAATFDAAVCINALDHMMAPRQCLREIARVLKPGGRLILGIYTHNRLLLAVRRTLEKLLPALGSSPHPSTYSLPEIREELERVFDVEAAECVHRATGLLARFHREYWVFVASRGGPGDRLG